MTDYEHDLEFGYFLIPDAADPAGVVETAQLADALGYDVLGVQDHPYQRAHLDSLALIGVILGRTERVRAFQHVANLQLRAPAVLAKAVATFDLLSDGRIEFGIGAGGFSEAVQSMGGPKRTPGESIEALEEAIAVARGMWSGERSLRFEGRHYRLDGVRPGPAPERAIGVWVGAARPRALRLTGRLADAWVTPLMSYVPPAAAAEGNATIDAAARKAGRDPRDIRRIYAMPGAFTATAPAPATDADTSIVGPPEHWVEVLTHLALDHGFGTLMLIAPPDPDTLRTYIEEVAPRVRERVTEARASRS
jgi:alkanesulfonate monooxygenase SsuD/methylene tetrahydromethanopterin reductase-like flavin-dependent oxidoreductase (luciferase family)